MSSKVNISLDELNQILDYITEHQDEFEGTHLLTFEFIPGAIGTATIAKFSEYANSPVLFAVDVTDYSEW